MWIGACHGRAQEMALWKSMRVNWEVKEGVGRPSSGALGKRVCPHVPASVSEVKEALCLENTN